MSRGLGYIERTIAAEIERAKSSRDSYGNPVNETSQSIALACFRSNGRKVSRRAATGAMHLFVRT